MAQRRTLSAFETILLNQRQSTTGLGLAHGNGDLGSKVRSFSTFRELQPEGTYGIQTRSLHMKSGPLDYRSSFALQAALAGNYSYEESSKKAADDDGLEILPEIVSALAKKGITKLFPIQVSLLYDKLFLEMDYMSCEL